MARVTSRTAASDETAAWMKANPRAANPSARLESSAIARSASTIARESAAMHIAGAQRAPIGAAKVGIVRRRPFGARTGAQGAQALNARQQRPADVRGNLFLHPEDVFYVSLVGLRPQMRVRLGGDELCIY